MSVTKCPVILDLERIASLSKSLTALMRKLRSDLRLCERCDHAENCQTLKTFNDQVRAAVDMVNDQWNQES